MNDTLAEIRKQTGYARDSAKAAQDAANAAAETAKLARMQAEGTEAATLSLIRGYGINSIHFALQNRGRTTANDATAQLSVIRKTWPDKRPVGAQQAYIISGRPLPLDDRTIEKTVDRIFNQSDWDHIANLEQFIEVQWTASYDNGFGRTITLRGSECVFYFPQIQIDRMRYVGNTIPANVRCDTIDDSMSGALKSRSNAIAERDRLKQHPE